MATNQYGQTYKGNDDFRGWLAAGNSAPYLFGNDSQFNKLSSQAKANILLNNVGNDGKTGNSELADMADYNYRWWLSQRKTNAANPTGTASTTSGTSGGGGSSYNAEEEALKSRMRGIYDKQAEDIKSNINSLGSQLDNDLAAVKGEYDQYKNEQESAYEANKNDYDNSTKQNQQDLETNRNDITNRASTGLRGLLRVLGAMGAGGGSVARYEAPGMVTSQANSEMSNAGRTYAQNQSNLDTDWGNYQNEFENDKKKLEDWYNGQVKAKKQANEEKRQSLLADLVTAYGNRAQYGGDYGNNINDAYKKIAESRNRVTDLGKFTTPNYTGKTAVFKSPDLASYNTGNTQLSTTVTDSNTSASSPLLVALRGLNKKKTNSPYANAEA